MCELKQFTFFRNYYDVIKELPNREEFAFSILEYVFDNKNPQFDGLNKGIWQLMERPLQISKNKSQNAKKKSKENQMKIKLKSSDNQSHYSISNSISNSISKEEKNNRGMGEEKKEETPLVIDDTSTLGEFTKQVIEYLNFKTDSNFKHSSKSTQQKINARLNEGYHLDDFKTVIDKKVAEWQGTDFEKYLRPETLFGSKFEGYFNQKIIEKKSSNPFLDYAKEKGYL